MTVQIRKAERRKAKLRIGVFGSSGSGKSMGGLLMASGMTTWEKICVIDTENGSADLYSHLGPYSVISITPPYHPQKYVDAIVAAGNAGFEVIIVDSITHEWAGTGGMLELVDNLQMRDGRAAWAKMTPTHNRFMDAILQSPAHVICCGRSKQEHVISERSNAKGLKRAEVEKLGLKAVTREGFDYEMTVSFDVDMRHLATCSKDRTTGEDGRALFQDRPPQVITAEYGKTLLEWANAGKDAPPTCASCKVKEGVTVEITAEQAERTVERYQKPMCGRHEGLAEEYMAKKKEEELAKAAEAAGIDTKANELEDVKARMSPFDEWTHAINSAGDAVSIEAVIAQIQKDGGISDTMRDVLTRIAEDRKGLMAGEDNGENNES